MPTPLPQTCAHNRTCGHFPSPPEIKAPTLDHSANPEKAAARGGILYDIANNAIIGANAIGQVGLESQIAGFGDFNGDGTTDMLLRSTLTGDFEVYDIANSRLVPPLGNVGLEW